ncbi:caspase-8 [Centropristis striata]|uniref:caspase-8 n=1 Tax=Centropristis striata TaxID=184440 RepID=UPI0027DFEBC7|nr:caspase-8 [Centropristis striata]XP_059201360.1 caspase-8 [Centropristis striata]
MDRLKLSRIDEELESSEVQALCFLCRDVINRKRLEGIADAKSLFLRLEEKCLLENDSFLVQLLQTIRRADLLNLLETDSSRQEETDANPPLSEYRVMLYRVYEDMTTENLEKMKFLLSNKLGRRQTENCNTALDVFAEMEKTGILSDTNLQELLTTLQQFDQQLVATVHHYVDRRNQLPPTRTTPQVTMYQTPNNNNTTRQPAEPMEVSMSQPTYRREDSLCSDAEPRPLHSPDDKDYYDMNHNPRGLCVVINNEEFPGTMLGTRRGTQEDAKVLDTTFTRLGFTVEIHKNLTAEEMRLKLRELGKRNFLNDDALVVCVLSHGEEGTVFGTDEKQVSLRDLTQPFKSVGAPTLAGKPKLFFIQACQGSGYQRGSVPCPPLPSAASGDKQSRLEEDAGPVRGKTVPWDADFLLGMATVPQCKSFRNTSMGSIYIQELCRQLIKSAESSETDHILDVLTRVNREVSEGEYLNYKQMPEPKYTLTKKLVLKFV